MSESSPQPPEPARRRGRPGHDQAAVLQRAIELFNDQGYDATSIEAIARSLGVTKSAIYHHVASKEELLGAALDEALDGLSAVLESAAAGPSRASAGARLRTTVEEAVRILSDHVPAVTLLLQVRGNSPLEEAALARRRVIDERFAALVQEAVDEGSVRADIAPDLLSRLVFGMVNSVAEWYRPTGPLAGDDLARAVAGVVFDGLAAPGE